MQKKIIIIILHSEYCPRIPEMYAKDIINLLSHKSLTTYNSKFTATIKNFMVLVLKKKMEILCLHSIWSWTWYGCNLIFMCYVVVPFLTLPAQKENFNWCRLHLLKGRRKKIFLKLNCKSAQAIIEKAATLP